MCSSLASTVTNTTLSRARRGQTRYNPDIVLDGARCSQRSADGPPSLPQAITAESMVTDIIAMKRLNFNAVRCSHYPNDQRWCADAALTFAKHK